MTPPVRLIALHVYIMLGIDWIDDIKVQVFCIKFLAQLKSRTHPTVTTSHYLVVLSQNGR